MIHAVMFDLDGTLVDSAPDLVAALNQVRIAEGLAPMPYEELRTASAYGAAGLVGRGLPPADEQVTEQRKQQFLDFYQDEKYQRSQLFDGVRELLDWLGAQAIPWGVVTNKWERFTLPVLENAGILTSSGCVICGDTLETVKPHPAPVQLACELLGANPERALMVGDDLRDLQAGQAAGCHSVFVNWGYGDLDDDQSDLWPRFDAVQSLQRWLVAANDAGQVFSGR